MWSGIQIYSICLILPLLCLTELLPPFISQTLRDGTPQVQISPVITYAKYDVIYIYIYIYIYAYNDILLPARIIIVTLWIELLCVVSDMVCYY